MLANSPVIPAPFLVLEGSVDDIFNPYLHVQSTGQARSWQPTILPPELGKGVGTAVVALTGLSFLIYQARTTAEVSP